MSNWHLNCLFDTAVALDTLKWGNSPLPLFFSIAGSTNNINKHNNTAFRDIHVRNLEATWLRLLFLFGGSRNLRMLCDWNLDEFWKLFRVEGSCCLSRISETYEGPSNKPFFGIFQLSQTLAVHSKFRLIYGAPEGLPAGPNRERGGVSHGKIYRTISW